MSDLTELWKYLTGEQSKEALSPAAFVAKEEQNLRNAIAALPAPVQAFVDVGVSSAAAVGEVAVAVAGTAVSGVISAGVPVLEAAFVALLTRAFGTTDAKVIADAAKTPAGATVIQQVGDAAVALVQHLAAQASAGIAIGAAAIEPPVNADPAPAPTPLPPVV